MIPSKQFVIDHKMVLDFIKSSSSSGLESQVQSFREMLSVTKIDLRKAGIHPSLVSRIESKQKLGWTRDSFIKYIGVIIDVANRKNGTSNIKAELSLRVNLTE